jgi:hypothetical protein
LIALLKACNDIVKIPESHRNCESGLPSKAHVTMNMFDRFPNLGRMTAIIIFTAATAPNFAPVEGQ